MGTYFSTIICVYSLDTYVLIGKEDKIGDLYNSYVRDPRVLKSAATRKFGNPECRHLEFGNLG